jgi:hypothetical protein
MRLRPTAIAQYAHEVLPNCRLAAGGGRRSNHQRAYRMVEPRRPICQRYDITIMIRIVGNPMPGIVALECDAADFAE